MRIALISPYDFAQTGGVTRHVRELGLALRARGHEVDWLAPCSRPQAGVISLGGHIVSFPYNGARAPVTFSPAVWRRLCRQLEAGRYDVVHVHAPCAPLVSLAAWCALARQRETAVVATFHEYAPHNWSLRLGGGVVGRLLQRADLRLAVSEPTRQMYSQYLPGVYRVVPNGIDWQRFAQHDQTAPTHERAGRPATLLFVGRLERRKGLTLLLQAYARLKAQGYDALRLIVAGSYSREEALPFVRWRDRQGWCDDDIRFLGPVADADLPALYRQAGVFCAPALGGESFGLVLLEALASGLPVVASDIPGYRATLTAPDGNVAGLLFQAGSVDKLANALAFMLEHDRSRLKLAMMGQALAHRFDWSEVVEQILECYAEALAKRVVSDEHRVIKGNGVHQALTHHAVPGTWIRG